MAICSKVNNNIIPIHLDRDFMSNKSPQLSDFIYDFSPCNIFEIENKFPDWMTDLNTIGKLNGCIKIKQNICTQDIDILKFSTIGNLRGVDDGNIKVYYFPQSLNKYDNIFPDGGEVMIELQQKPRGNITDKKDLERLLIFIPVEKVNDGEKSKSITWFEKVLPVNTLDSGIEHATKSVSLNDIIPQDSFWIYNDISVHGLDCNDDGGQNSHYKKMNAIFFTDTFIKIKNTDFDTFFNLNQENGITNDLKSNCSTENNVNWCAAWYPTNATTTVTEPTETAEPDEEAAAINEENKADEKRLIATINKGTIFLNNNGTKRGPGDHNDAGDPFSLTCEPIIDADSEEPLDGNRLDWVSGVYNAIPKGMKNVFWLAIFVLILTGILMSIYVFIFKNIAAFVTGNEILLPSRSDGS